MHALLPLFVELTRLNSTQYDATSGSSTRRAPAPTRAGSVGSSFFFWLTAINILGYITGNSSLFQSCLLAKLVWTVHVHDAGLEFESFGNQVILQYF